MMRTFGCPDPNPAASPSAASSTLAVTARLEGALEES